MGYIRKGVLGYVVLSLFLINQVSAKQVKPKKLKARANILLKIKFEDLKC